MEAIGGAAAISGLYTILASSAQVLESLGSLRSAPQELFAILTELHALNALLEEFARVTSSDQEDVSNVIPHSLIVSCITTVKELAHHAEKLGSLAGDGKALTAFKIRWLFFQTKFKRLKIDLDRQKATFSVLLAAYNGLRLRSTEKELLSLRDNFSRVEALNLEQIVRYERQLQEASEKEQRKADLAAISTYDVAAVHHSFGRLQTADTCRWFLSSDVYRQWMENLNATLVLFGPPGCGKSILCSAIVNDLHRSVSSSMVFHSAVAYFYINELESVSETVILRAILRQLLEQAPAIYDKIAARYDLNEIRNYPVQSISELTSIIEYTRDLFVSCFICIDGFDCLAEDSADSLFQELQKLCSSRVAIIITCRYSQQSATRFQSVAFQKHIEQTDIAHDINIAVRFELDRSKRFQKYPDLIRDVFTTIESRADKSFLWASAMVKHVLQQRSPRSVQNALRGVPSSLRDRYLQAWEELMQASDEDSQQTQKAIEVLCMAGYPLRVEVLQKMVESLDVSKATEFEWSLLPIMLLTLDRYGTVRFSHYSVLEVLRERQRPSMDSRRFFDILYQIDSVQAQHSENSRLDVNREWSQNFKEEDTISLNSWSSEPFSTTSSTLVDSNSSISSLSQGTVAEQLAHLFIQHYELKNLCVDLLKALGITGFTNFFSNQLKQYSEELQILPGTIAQEVAARMAGQKTHDIAYSVALNSGFVADKKVAFSQTLANKDTISTQKRIEKFLESRDTPTEKRKNIGTKFETSGTFQSVASAADVTERITETGEYSVASQNDEDEEILINLQRIQTFLLSSQPFKDMLSRIRIKLYPVPDIPQFPLEGDVKGSNSSERALSLRRFVLSLIPGGEMPVEPTMKRIRWKCACGRKYYDDFHEIRPGTVNKLQSSMIALYERSREEQATIQQRYDVTSPWVVSILLPTCLVVHYSVNWLSKFLAVAYLSSLLILLSVLLSITILVICMILFQFHSDCLVAFTSLNTEDSVSLYKLESEDNPLLKTAQAVSESVNPIPDLSSATSASSPSTSSAHQGADRTRRDSESIDITQMRRTSPSRGNNPSVSSDEEQISSRTQRTQRAPAGQRQLWALPIFLDNNNDEIALHVNATRHNTDFALFYRFRKKYLAVSSCWKRFVKLQEVKTIDFVKFTLSHPRNAYILTPKEAWPPASVVEWTYDLPSISETIPHVPPKKMMKMWTDVHHADLALYEAFRRRASWRVRLIDWLRHIPHVFCQSVREALDDDPIEMDNLPPQIYSTDVEQAHGSARSKKFWKAIPKKIGERLHPPRDDDDDDTQDPEAWGLYFSESFAVHRLLFFFLILYSIFTLGVFSWLIAQKHYDMPELALTIEKIAVWFGSFLALTCSVWLKWGETRFK